MHLKLRSVLALLGALAAPAGLAHAAGYTFTSIEILDGDLYGDPAINNAGQIIYNRHGSCQSGFGDCLTLVTDGHTREIASPVGTNSLQDFALNNNGDVVFKIAEKLSKHKIYAEYVEKRCHDRHRTS